MTLLEGLDKIDWSQEAHAYGVATDVPVLLRILVDPSSAPADFQEAAEEDQGSVLKQAMFELGGNVVHQGTVYGVTAKVVPFIAEIACAESVALETREFAIGYLQHIVSGATSWPKKVDLEKFGNGPSAKLSAVEAVERQVPRLLPLLDTKLAASTIGLLATLERVAESTVPSLWKISQTHVDDPLGGMALVALARLDQPGVADAARVMCDSINGAHVGMVYAAVADLLASPGESVSAVAVNVLLNVPDPWAKMLCPFDSTVASTTEGLREWLPRSARAELIKRLAIKLRKLAPSHRPYALTEMMKIVELDGELPLDSLHREVIRLIVEHYPWSTHSGDRWFFEGARLPADRYQLQLLGRG